MMSTPYANELRSTIVAGTAPVTPSVN